MKIKFIKDEDIVNYKKISMFIGAVSCTWKCCIEAGLPCSLCQNYPWSKNDVIVMSNEELVQRYLNNPLTEAIVIGGLEPFDQFKDMMYFIAHLRHYTDDDVVIYTGYNRAEIEKEVKELQRYSNIIIKYGRYIPNKNYRYDEVLDVKLASDNQYAVKES